MGKLIKAFECLPYNEMVEALEAVSPSSLKMEDDNDAGDGDEILQGVEINGVVYDVDEPVINLIQSLMETIEQLQERIVEWESREKV